MSEIKENEIQYLMSLAEKRYREECGKELNETEKDSIYYSILGVYHNENYDAAYNYVLNATLGLRNDYKYDRKLFVSEIKE
ncbi:MAG: hypothetical protein NC416_01200 [Eubacterium sp.]|nr:hypothetical protein [Eubacterium sp.]